MMIFKFWLIVCDNGAILTRKRDYGSLAEGEVAIPMTVRVPDAWFYRRTKVVEVNVDEPEFPSLTVSVETGEVID